LKLKIACPICFYLLLFVFTIYNAISVAPANADSSFSIYCISNGDGTANCTRDDNQLSISCVGSPGATVECTSKDNNKYECVPLSIAQTGQIQVQLSCSPEASSSFGGLSPGSNSYDPNSSKPAPKKPLPLLFNPVNQNLFNQVLNPPGINIPSNQFNDSF
jgi:hypothetical protein